MSVEPVLVAEYIEKRFPGVPALDDVSLTVFPGEVHAVPGKNGAGKSAPMKILAGAYPTDHGMLKVDGESVAIDSPRTAQQLGIITIYQELSLVDALSVGEEVGLAGLVDGGGCSGSLSQSYKL
jgi:ribose transport system ATP-binding protein